MVWKRKLVNTKLTDEAIWKECNRVLFPECPCVMSSEISIKCGMYEGKMVSKQTMRHNPWSRDDEDEDDDVDDDDYDFSVY